MWLRKCFLLAGLLAVAGASGAAPFALCMYGVDDPADIPLLKKAGFNCLQTYRQDPALLARLAQAAEKEGLKTVFYPNPVIGSSYEAQARAWPMLAWYLVDEPDVAGWSRERVLQSRLRAQAAFPSAPTALVVGQGKTMTPFYDLPDIFMVDWYPVPHLPLASFGQQIALARAEIDRTGQKNKPLWAVVQAFNWKEYEQYRPDSERIGRFPTQQEIRFMSYDAIMNGATGLFYFTFTTQGRPLPQARPQWWARVSAVSRELAAFRPVLEEGKTVKNPVPESEGLRMKTWKYQGDKYTLLLNPSDTPRPLPKKLLKDKYQLLFGAEKTPRIPAYEAWILRY